MGKTRKGFVVADIVLIHALDEAQTTAAAVVCTRYIIQ
jgi:hypothetical protein